MKIRKNDEEGFMYFKLCGEQFKFGKEKCALISGLKFDNCKTIKRKINVVGTPTLFAKFFPHENTKKRVSGAKLKDVFRRDISSGRMECFDDDLLSLSYLMIINEINSKSSTTKVEIRYFYLATYWGEMNNFPWANDSFMSTTESAQRGILNGFNQVNDKKTYSIGGLPITL